MLSINVTIVPEMWDEDNELFIEEQTVTLELEHSLVSLSKWESKWKRSFMSSKQEMTAEETIDYIKFMTITPNVDSDVYEKLSVDNVTEINNYIADNQTATTFSDKGGKKRNNEIITSEIIYYWMTSLGIPFDPCETWHLSRLIALIRVCSIKNAPTKKKSARELSNQYAALNAARRQQLNSKG